MGRIVTITSWPEDHSVPVLTVEAAEFVVPFNTATTMPASHFAVLQAAAVGNPLVKFTDGGAAAEPAATLTLPVKTERARRSR